MSRNIRFSLFLLILSSCHPVQAQINTYSPYSRFGLGRRHQDGFPWNKAMGGLGIGLTDNKQINMINPASYVHIDSLSFLFNFGLSGSNTRYVTESETGSGSSFNLDHIAIAFPIADALKTSFGVLPYSSVGYNILEKKELETVGTVENRFQGAGGITQLYMGASLRLFKNLSAGINVVYLFGNLEMGNNLVFPSVSDYSVSQVNRKTLVNGFIYRLGSQYTASLSENLDLTAGVILEPANRIGLEQTVTKKNSFPGSSVTVNDTLLLEADYLLDEDFDKTSFGYPLKAGGGFSLCYRDKFTVGAGYSSQDWNGKSLPGLAGTLAANNTFHLGMEYIPDAEAIKGYWKRISYRLGARIESSYLELNENHLKDYGISFGVGLPVRNLNTSFNLACQMGIMGTKKDHLIQERYIMVSFNITFHDFWFLKRKFD